MRKFIYDKSPYAFGTSLALLLIGGALNFTPLVTAAAWVGLIGSFIWCWNVILDQENDRKDRFLLNAVPLIWFLASWYQLFAR